MPVNDPSGEMYPWAYTWNPVGGSCPHQCSYCYVPDIKASFKAIDEKYTGKLRLMEHEFKPLKRLPEGYVLFVCNMLDLFADDMPGYIIEGVLEHCGKYPNQYLFQTKNPGRFYEYYEDFPGNTILGTTIETNRRTDTKAPQPMVRYGDMIGFHRFKKMVSIEPIMDVDIDVMVAWIEDINPLFVSIGADSKKHNLKEPTGEKIRELIMELERITEVRIKKNLKPLFEGEKYWYVSNIPRICTNCKNRIKIGMTYYIPPGAGVLCSDCGQEHLEMRKRDNASRCD